MWRSASCSVMSLRANIPLPPHQPALPLWYANVWIASSFSSALSCFIAKGESQECPLLVFFFRRGRKWKVSSEDVVTACGTDKHRWPLALPHSCRMEKAKVWLWLCSLSSRLKSLVWHWATQAFFIIDFTALYHRGSQGVCVCLCVYCGHHYFCVSLKKKKKSTNLYINQSINPYLHSTFQRKMQTAFHSWLIRSQANPNK